MDNGRIWFDNFEIPREGGMLDRFAQVHPDGGYTSVFSDIHLRSSAHTLGSIIHISSPV